MNDSYLSGVGDCNKLTLSFSELYIAKADLQARHYIE